MPPSHEDRWEKELISAFIVQKLSPSALEQSIKIKMSEQDFSNHIARSLFVAISELDIQGEPIDLVSLTHQVKSQIPTTQILEIIKATNEAYLPPSQLKKLCLIIKKNALRRNLHTIIEENKEDPLRAKALVEAIPVNWSETDTVEAQQLLHSYKESFYTEKEKIIQRGYNGVPTGFVNIDAKCPLIAGDLFVIGAASSVGKTSLATSIAINTAKRGIYSLFITAEMTAQAIMFRFLSSLGGISFDDFLNYSDEAATIISDEEKITPVISNFNLIEASSLDYLGICQAVLREHARRKVGVCFVDYLQLIKSNKTDKYQTENDRIALIIKAFKKLAQTIEAPIVLLSQVSRDYKNASEGVPELHHLRGSGDIEQTADKIVCLGRKDKQSPIAQAIIRKNRNGEADFMFELAFDAKTTTYKNLHQIPNYLIKNHYDKS